MRRLLPDNGDFSLLHDDLGSGFDTHIANGRSRWAHKNDAGLLTQVSELDIFGKKSITRMNSLGSRFFSHLNDLILSQI